MSYTDREKEAVGSCFRNTGLKLCFIIFCSQVFMLILISTCRDGFVDFV